MTSTVEHIANHSVTQLAGDVATKISEHADQFDTAAAAAGQAMRTKAGQRLVAAATGALVERLRPGNFDQASRVVAKVADKVGLQPGVIQGASGVLSATLKSAGIVAIGYDAVRSFSDTKADMGSRLAQAGAAIAVGAATFTGVGTAVVAVDLVTGGGVTGGAKGLVALADAALTGDRDALNSWVDSAKSGDQGWLLKKLANNQTVANVATRGAEAVINAGARARESVSSFVSNGWKALTSW